MNNLNEYGLSDCFIKEAKLYPNLILGRVISQYSDLYRVVTNDDDFLASVSGKYQYNSQRAEDYPVVGDFVMLDRSNDKNGNGVIHHSLTRKAAFKRAAAGAKNEAQVVASNIDIVFLCMAMNNDFNVRRLERYLSAAWDSGATPVVLLTKADVCEDVSGVLGQAQGVALGVDILVTSSMDNSACEKVLPYFKSGITASFIGSSGVGKSTLINRLAGNEALATAGTRGDDKGRHTTTRRELMVLPQGGAVIDTPGMRELGLDGADLSKTFADIDELILKCRFTDCSHTGEAGCAVLEAINSGELATERYESYKKLEVEALYNGLSSRQIENEKINRMFGGKSSLKQFQAAMRAKNKR